jgi:hypothetical protein
MLALAQGSLVKLIWLGARMLLPIEKVIHKRPENFS